MNPSVKLVGITKPVIPECSEPDHLIAYCARVSNPKNQANHGTASKLLRYLIKEQHWSPLEMVNIVMEVRTTRDIARQILRHRSFSFQEFSQRYAEVEGNFQYRETRLQDTKNRQNSIETQEISIISNWNMIQDEVIDFVSERYKEALDLGIAKEQARSLLPEGLTPSVMYMNGNLRSWVHYCALRMGNGTQKEHSEIAKLCWNILLEQFPFLDDPIITEALNLYRKENNLD